MNLGPLNRRGMLKLNTPVPGDGGAPVDVLTDQRQLYLTVEEEETQTADVVAERVSLNATVVWLSRWFDGLKSDMFVEFEGTTYRIVRCKQLGRREGYRIFGTEYR